MSISGIFVYQFRPTILSKLNRTISSSDENSIRRAERCVLFNFWRPTTLPLANLRGNIDPAPLAPTSTHTWRGAAFSCRSLARFSFPFPSRRRARTSPGRDSSSRASPACGSRHGNTAKAVQQRARPEGAARTRPSPSSMWCRAPGRSPGEPGTPGRRSSPSRPTGSAWRRQAAQHCIASRESCALPPKHVRTLCSLSLHPNPSGWSS